MNFQFWIVKNPTEFEIIKIIYNVQKFVMTNFSA